MESLSIITRSYDLYKHFTDLWTHLPKKWRFSLGASIEQNILSLLEYLIMAKNAPKPAKAQYLIKANAMLEIITLKFRLLLDLKLANETRIFQLQAQASEIGRMLGGWLKSTQNN